MARAKNSAINRSVSSPVKPLAKRLWDNYNIIELQRSTKFFIVLLRKTHAGHTESQNFKGHLFPAYDLEFYCPASSGRTQPV